MRRFDQTEASRPVANRGYLELAASYRSEH
jgi:hypothetical protein